MKIAGEIYDSNGKQILLIEYLKFNNPEVLR